MTNVAPYNLHMINYIFWFGQNYY